MSKIDVTYHALLEQVYKEGFEYADPNRKGVTRLQIPVYRLEHDLQESFPAIATKKLAWKTMVSELMWFLKGGSNIKKLHEEGNRIWDKDAYSFYKKLYTAENNGGTGYLNFHDFLEAVEEGVNSTMIPHYIFGDMGGIYGPMWRNFYGHDQIERLLDGMINKPMSTEHIVTAWDPSVNTYQALPPCHFGFQVMMQPLDTAKRCEIYVKQNAGKLMPAKMFTDDDLDEMGIAKYGFTLIWQQRSVDVFLGLPFNIASYALLAHIIGRITNSVPLKLVGDLRNVHLYNNSINAAAEQVSRDAEKHGPAKLLMKDEFHNMCDDKSYMNPVAIIEHLRTDMFKLYKYNPDESIKVEMLERT